MESPPAWSSAQTNSSYNELLAKLRERIVAFAASRIQRDAAEDLAQEVLVVIHEKYGQLDRVEDLLPLALQIVRWKMVAYRRKAQRHGEYKQVDATDVPLLDMQADPLTRAQRQEMMTRLKAALQSLGERCRKMMALKLDGKSFTEIQAAFGVASINTIYTWDFRCRKQLLEQLGEDWDSRL